MQNQHFVPQLLLKNFADTDGRLFYLDKRNDHIGKVSPKKAASDTDFYEFNIDGEAFSFEERFQKYETKAGKGLKKLTSGQSPLLLSDAEREDLAAFVALQSFRTEAFLMNLRDHNTREERGKTLSRMWDSLFLSVPLIAARHWMIMQIEHEESFYLGDNPVVLQNTEHPSAKGSLGFDVQGVEAFMPLTPKLALYLPCPSISNQIIKAHYNGLVMQRELWASGVGVSIDAVAVSNALRGTKPLYDAAVHGTALPAPSTSVLNLNYLQSAWAHKHLYANSNKFETARMVFSKSPQYRQPPTSGYAQMFSRNGQE
ncbi:DUF4238 domain-containing protein [Agrobacterium tumefaciens]|nr:DUF4238 domain-containing protein [Agrobacterium tumefaciens]